MIQLLDSVQVLGAPELTGAGSSWGIAPAPKISPAKVTGENRHELAVSAERGCAPSIAGRQLTDSNLCVKPAGLATGPLVIQSRKVKLHSPNTKPIGRDTENVTINLPIAEAKLLAKIAFDAVRSRGDLIKELLLIGAAQKFGAVVSEQIQKIRANHRELVTNGGLAGAAFALLCFGLVVFQECAHLGKLRQIRTSAKAGFARIAKQKRDENFTTDLDFAQEV